MKLGNTDLHQRIKSSNNKTRSPAIIQFSTELIDIVKKFNCHQYFRTSISQIKEQQMIYYYFLKIKITGTSLPHYGSQEEKILISRLRLKLLCATKHLFEISSV